MTAHFVNLLDEINRRSLRMAWVAADMLQEAEEALFLPGDALARRVIARDADVDAEEVAVEAEVIRLLALFQPVGHDLRLLCTVLKVNSDLERIADGAVNIAKRARRLDADSVSGNVQSLQTLFETVRQLVRHTIDAYGAEDLEAARNLAAEEEAADAVHAEVMRSVIDHAVDSPERMVSHLDTLAVAKNLERIADHAANIAEDVIYLATGEIVRHAEEE